MKRSPDLTTIMTECPLDHQACFPEESVRDFYCATRHAQLSVSGQRVLDRLLGLLPTHIHSQSISRGSAFPPALLFSICEALRDARADGRQTETSVLPSVLSKLRDWRLLDSEYRHSPGGVHNLALDLAAITDEAEASVTSTSSDSHPMSRGRLRIKWVGSDSPRDGQDRETSSSTPPSPSRSGTLPLSHQCAYALPDSDERRFDTGHCQVGRLGTPDSEDVSRRRPSVSGFRSGCSACRHPRVSGPSAPPSPQMPSFPRMPFGDITHLDTIIINAAVQSPRPKPSVQHTPRKTKQAKPKSVHATARAHVDENEPPVPKPARQATGISFPRQRTHSPRISNALLFRESIPCASTQPQPRHRTRQSDTRTSSHRAASIDLRLPLPMANRTHSHSRSQADASPIDHHPTCARGVSCTPVAAQGLGGPVRTTLSSNAVAGSSRLPLWSQGHPWRHSTMMMTTASASSSSPFANPLGSVSPPVKPGVGVQNLLPLTRSGPSSRSIPVRVSSDVGRRDRDRRSVAAQTHMHTRSAGAIPSLPPLLAARTWLV